MTDLSFDPFDPSQTQNMWELMAELRARAPVSRPMPGFVYVARHADIKTVFRDAERFSSREGFRGANVTLPLEESFMGEIDPPLHTDLRVLLLQAFRPGLEKRAEAFTRACVERLWDAVAAAGGGDLVADFGLNIPPAVTGHILGIAPDDIERVGRWGFELIHSSWPETNATERGVGLGGAFPEFAAFLDEQIHQRRAATDPPDDILTRMTRAEADGHRLSDVQIRTLCANVLLASLSTTNLIGNLLLRFMTDRDFEDALRADPALVPVAVEESLRFEPPVLFLFRTARVDTDLSGEAIARGERIIMGIASGNRDERVYDRAHEFHLDRVDPPEHLTFGPGPHLCLGNQVARMEARVALEIAMERFPAGGLSTAPGFELELVPMFLEFGPERLDAVVSSA